MQLECRVGNRNPTAEKFHRDRSHRAKSTPEQQRVSGKEAELPGRERRLIYNSYHQRNSCDMKFPGC